MYISIGLFCHESTSYTTASSLVGASQKLNKTSAIGKEILLWQAKGNYEHILSMDIPFMIPLPFEPGKALPPTLTHHSRSTTYELVATLHSTQFASQRVAIEVIIERFDTLPAFTMFASPVVLRPMSPDHVVEMQVDLKRTCLGPEDLLPGVVTISGNPDWISKVKKVRIEKISMSIDQIVTYKVENSAEPYIKCKKISDRTINIGGIKIIDKPYVQHLAVLFPAKELKDKAGFLEKAAMISPSDSSFTTHCSLFSVEFEVVIKATLRGAKDVQVAHPITISQYNMKTSETIMQNIENAVYEHAHVEVYSGVAGAINIERKEDEGRFSPVNRRRTLIMD